MGTVDDILAHHGVKGMKWGVRKDRSSGPTVVKVRAESGKKLKTKGGHGYTPTEDAIRAAVGRQVAKKSGVHSLTNEELKVVVNRMQLERQYKQLTIDASPGKKFVSSLLGQVGRQNATNYANQQVGDVIKRRGK